VAIFPNYKEIVELVKKGSTLEAQEKILELRSAVLGIEEENIALKKQVKVLETRMALKEKATYARPSYWLIENDAKDGPYCQVCFDRDSKLIRLQGGKGGAWVCLGCRSRFFEDSYKPPTLRKSSTPLA
jgi:ribosomal protein L37AE/L43A